MQQPPDIPHGLAIDRDTAETPGADIQLVHLHPSSPSIRSIIRVVAITLVLLYVAGSVGSMISSLKNFIFLIVLSIFFAYLIDPLVSLIRQPFKQRGLEKWMPRALAIPLAFIFVFTIVGVAISSIAPRVVDQAKEFGLSVPSYAEALRTRGAELNRRFDRLRIPDEIQAELNRRAASLGSAITESVGNFVLNLITYIPWFVLVPILSFFFLKDVNAFRLAVLRMFPAGRWRVRAESVLSDVNSTLAAYTRAQLISCLLIGIICTTGFYIFGLKYALLLGILAGVFEFVPLLGPLTIGVIATLTAAVSDNPWRAVYVVIFLITLRIIHDYVTYPRIVRGGIHLHPLAIILSVLAGEQIAGIPGVFIAIPIVAVATVIYHNYLEHSGRRNLMAGLVDDMDRSAEVR
jgi:predicted PurR-regulated permease PerM